RWSGVTNATLIKPPTPSIRPEPISRRTDRPARLVGTTTVTGAIGSPATRLASVIAAAKAAVAGRPYGTTRITPPTESSNAMTGGYAGVLTTTAGQRNRRRPVPGRARPIRAAR